MSNSSQPFKVGLVGPSRIGKTTLIAAVFEQGRQILQEEGDPVQIKAEARTQRALKTNHAAITAAVDTGRFDPESLPGTEGAFKHELTFTLEDETRGIHVLDFPGSWLTDDVQRWEQECEPWLRESAVLLVPVDATLLVEPETAGQFAVARHALALFEARDVIVRWAQAIKQSGLPALLAFVPIKTETYFGDNGGTGGRSAELRRRFDKFYGPFVEEALRVLGEHARDVRIEYHPVDTLGCVELQGIAWKASPGLPAPTFEVRRNKGYSPLGADDLLASILRTLLSHVDAESSKEARRIQQRIDEDKGFIGNFFYHVTERRGHERAVEGLRKKRTRLLTALERIANRPPGRRVERLGADDE